LVPIEGFDEMMVQLNSYLGYELLDKKILSIAQKRADNYREQFEKIQKSKLSAETSKAIDETIKISKLGWWTVVLNASREKDPNKKEQIYLDGLKNYPESHYLIGNYANFLRNIRKDYDNAEKYYKKALELDPNLAITTGNYASFLCHIRKDYDNAERYYKKSLELNPNDANNTGNYAIFLGDARKDYDNAEKYYKRAFEIEHSNPDRTGNYAKFLIETGDIPRAEEYIDNAFSLKPDNEILLVELWFYRYAIFPDKYKDAYENIVKLIKSGARSIGWNLKDIIEIAQKRGHKEIETLKKLDKIITEDAPIDILDNP